MEKKRVACLLMCLFLVVVLPLLSLQNSQVYAAPSWLAGWQYKKSHVITGAPGAGTNYQTQIKLYYNAAPFGYEERNGQFRASDYDLFGNLYIQGREPSAPDKLYKSTDGGKTFSVVYTLDAGGRFQRKALFIDSQNRIFISAEGFTSENSTRLLRSTDGGQTFSQVLAAPVWDMDEDASGNLYAGRYWQATSDGAKVYKSTNGGANWTGISSSSWTSENTSHVHRVRIDPTTGWLYATIGDTNGTGALTGLWRSKLKDGTDWVRIYGDTPTTLKSAFVGIVFANSYIYLGDDNELDNGRIYRFQDDGTSDLRTVSDSDLVLNITDGVNRAAFYFQKDDTGRMWVTFYPYPSPADGQLWTSEDGTTWTYRGTFCRTTSLNEVLDFNYMEAGVRHFRGEQESRFAVIGGNIRASFDLVATSLNGHSRADFGDVRFTGSDGITLLDYWIEEKVDGDYALFYVKVSEDLGSDQNIYVYYGKNDAATTSNGYNTFSYFDNFEDENIADWSIYTKGAGTVSISSTHAYGTYALKVSKPSGIANAAAASQQISASGIAQFRIGLKFYQEGSVSTTDGYHILAFETSKNAQNPTWAGAHVAHFNTGTTVQYYSSGWKLTDGQTIQNTWNRLLIEHKASTYNLFVNDSVKGSYDNFNSNNIQALHFGCQEDTFGGTEVGYFDDLFLAKFVDPEPMHSVWGSEEFSELVKIDQSYVSDGRANVSSAQTVGFHAKWSNNDSDVVGGTIYVNNTNYGTNATGWANLSVTSPLVGSKRWVVTGVNCGGVTVYTQTAPMPNIIWDQIKITDGGITKDSVILGENTTIWFKAVYEYENGTFNGARGTLYVNESPMAWSAINNRWEYVYTANAPGTTTFSISKVSDNSYNLTAISDTVGTQIVTIVSSPFSIISNSTISELAFNSTSKVLTFTVSGPSGTTGYTNVTIAKSLIGNMTDLKVYLDGNEINYTTINTDYFWLIHFTYHHSTHKVLITLGSSQVESFADKVIVICTAIMAILLTTLLITERKKQR
jgi:hypothetical protein